MLNRASLRSPVADFEQLRKLDWNNLVFMAKTRASSGTAKRAAAEKKQSRRQGQLVKEDSQDAPADPSVSKKRRRSAAPAAAAATASEGDDSNARPQHFYLMKSEPDVFSIDDLASRPKETEPWDGVRSHQAKKVMQSMRLGDLAFFYHSNAKPPGIVGVMEIVREAYPDHSQWDPQSEYYDKSTSPQEPKWFMVDCKLVRKLDRLISLDELKRHREGGLRDMHLFKYGRLSVQAVQPQEWEFVLGLEREQQE